MANKQITKKSCYEKAKKQGRILVLKIIKEIKKS